MNLLFEHVIKPTFLDQDNSSRMVIGLEHEYSTGLIHVWMEFTCVFACKQPHLAWETYSVLDIVHFSRNNSTLNQEEKMMLRKAMDECGQKVNPLFNMDQDLRVEAFFLFRRIWNSIESRRHKNAFLSVFVRIVVNFSTIDVMCIRKLAVDLIVECLCSAFSIGDYLTVEFDHVYKNAPRNYASEMCRILK
ncbi:hypothetical protein Ciccas_000950, partial [Cichlidogyrus casuarinus]